MKKRLKKILIEYIKLKMDNKYKNGKIYTIRYKNDDTLIYVGSTVQPLYKRFAKHKTDSKKPVKENRLLYQKFKETDINDWYVELYEDYSCERKEQLTQREGQVIREIGTLNKQIAGRTDKEYREDNKEKQKDYREHNREKILVQKKEYREDNKEKIQTRASEHIFCECGCSVRRDKISKHKRTLKHERIMKELTKTIMDQNAGQNL
jgi:hypothetical protein